ncbi:hypothetical protein Tco_0633242 [Tanacetum coccineum]
MNLKLLRSLPSEWKTHALIWRNKEEIETISLDDFHYTATATVAQMKSYTAFWVSAALTQSNPTSGDNLMLSCSRDGIGGYDWSYQVRRASYKLCFNGIYIFQKVLPIQILVENKKKLEKAEKERDELKLTLEKFQNSSKSLNNLLESQVSDKFKTGLGYNAASSTAASPAVESFVNSSEMVKDTTARDRAVVSENKGKGVNVVKASACWGNTTVEGVQREMSY